MSPFVTTTYFDEQLEADLTYSYPDPADLPSLLAFYRSDRDASSFNAAMFPQTSGSYLSAANSAWLNGLTKMGIGGFVAPAGYSDGTLQALCCQDAAGQHCFRQVITAAGKVRVYIASSLSDGGANYLESSVIVQGGLGGTTNYHVWSDFDGTAVGNAGRLKLYVNGVLDAAATYTGTIPAALTASAAPLTLGYDGGTGPAYLEGQAWLWAATAGAVAGAPAVLALAAWNPSGNPTYYGWGSLPAGAPALAHFWPLGSPLVPPPALYLADRAGAAPFAAVAAVKGGTFWQWGDQSGLGNLGQSKLSQYAPANEWASGNPRTNLVVATPQLLAGQTPTRPMFKFGPGDRTPCNFNLGFLGLATIPAAWTTISVLAVDSPELSIALIGQTSEYVADSSLSGPCFGGLGYGDFSLPGAFNSYHFNGFNGGATNTPANVYTVGKVVVLAQRYTPGDDHTQIFLNGVEQTPYTKFHWNGAGSPVSSGGVASRYGLGQFGDADATLTATPGPNAIMRLGLWLACGATLSDAQLGRVTAWAKAWAGIAP
jgi:hypothetical protein